MTRIERTRASEIPERYKLDSEAVNIFSSLSNVRLRAQKDFSLLLAYSKLRGRKIFCYALPILGHCIPIY